MQQQCGRAPLAIVDITNKGMMLDEDTATLLPVGRRDAEAKNVADFGEGWCARAALAGGDGLDGSPDEADDAAVWPGRLSYLFMHACPDQTREARARA